MTENDFVKAKLLYDQSQAHLVDSYLAGKSPKHIETIAFDMSAIDEIPFEQINEHLLKNSASLDTLAPGSSVAILIYGRDGLSIDEDEWTKYETKYGHLTTTLIISEYLGRIATEVLTGWVDAVPHSPERVWCLFDTKRLVDNITGKASDAVYRRLIDKWSSQRKRRILLRESYIAEGGEPKDRNRVKESRGRNFGFWNPKRQAKKNS